jgi:hypothetical protein
VLSFQKRKWKPKISFDRGKGFLMISSQFLSHSSTLIISELQHFCQQKYHPICIKCALTTYHYNLAFLFVLFLLLAFRMMK